MYKVRVCLIGELTRDFEVESIERAREWAFRIVNEGLHYVKEDKTEEYFPLHLIFKVKIFEVNND